MLAFVGSDALVLRKVERVSLEFSQEVIQIESIERLDTVASASIIVLRVGEDISVICAAVKAMSSSALICGYLDPVDQQLWREAERLCFDAVTTKGALGPFLRELLAHGSERRQAVAICDATDIAGRLGFLMEVHDEHLGDVSLWRIESQLVATGRCPHQGECLGKGEIEESIVTCPFHGSRFDLLTGDRVRGPSDFDLTRYKVKEEKGRIWVSKG